MFDNDIIALKVQKQNVSGWIRYVGTNRLKENSAELNSTYINS